MVGWGTEESPKEAYLGELEVSKVVLKRWKKNSINDDC